MVGSTRRKQISLCTAAALTLSLVAMTAPVNPQEITAASVGTIAGAIIGASAAHNFTEQGLASDYFDITGNLSTGKGTMTYNGMTLTQCLKMESSTLVSFTTGSACTMTLAIKDGDTIYVDDEKYSINADGQTVIQLTAGAHTLKKGSGSSNLFYIDIGGGSGVVTTVTTDSGTQQTTAVTTATAPAAITGDLNVKSVGGWNEMAYMVIGGVNDSAVKKVSYSGATSGTLSGDDFNYLVRDTDDGVRIDIPGLSAGSYSISVETTAGNVTVDGIVVGAQDRSGYAHFNYTAGVGAYTDAGTLKSNAIVLYVTESNKDSVTVTSKDGTTVKGIGNILNSAGQDNGSGQTSKGGKPNTNSDIIEKLAKDGTPLVVRIIGNVTAPAGLTEFDSVNYGGSVGDNGYMARMQSGKDVTIEGIGTDACINGWGIHFIAETANQDAGESFEVRNIAFRNVPEDCVGMEGVQEGSKLTAPVEHCWIHNCEFYKPSIAHPAESDKDGGDGACDFKRGMYFTNSYCYYEGYHKTNLVGASDSNLQFHITFHHNYWKNCESRGPLARQANIHMYNNVFENQSSYCMNPRANAYIFSEYNVFESCKNPMQVKLGAVKSYKDVLNNCKGDQDGTVVTDKSIKVNTDCRYANFDTDASVSYIPSGNYLLNTDTASLKSVFEQLGGCMDENASGSGVIAVTPSTTTTASSTTATTTTTTTTTTTSSGGETAVLLGDVNCDGNVKVDDVILLNRFVAEDMAVSISGQGMANADVNASGTPDGDDAVIILKQLAGLNG